MEQRFRELSTDDVPSRLSSELIRLSKRLGSGFENGEIHLSQTDLAQLTGTTVSTVSRLLSRWEKLGIVSVRREAVQVHNVATLAQLPKVNDRGGKTTSAWQYGPSNVLIVNFELGGAALHRLYYADIFD